MTSALTPAAVLAWLRTLTAGLRAAVVTGADGAVLAGDPGLAERAAGAPSHASGDVLVARSATHAIAAEAGPGTHRGLLSADLREALALLRSV